MKKISIIIICLLVAFFLYRKVTRVNIEDTPCSEYYIKVLDHYKPQLVIKGGAVIDTLKMKIKNMKNESNIIDLKEQQEEALKSAKIEVRELKATQNQNYSDFTDSIKKYMNRNIHTYFYITEDDKRNFDKIAERIWY
mgnify:CR=1 FL=1